MVYTNGPKLSPAQRVLRARLAAQALHSLVDPKKHTEAARRAGPGNLDYWLRRVDPEGSLRQRERVRRAESAKKAHFTRLAFKSAQARSRKQST